MYAWCLVASCPPCAKFAADLSAPMLLCVHLVLLLVILARADEGARWNQHLRPRLLQNCRSGARKLGPSCLKPMAGGKSTDESYFVQKPYNRVEGQHFNVTFSTYDFMVLRDDVPFEMGNPTCPRTEMRFCNSWTSGTHEFASRVTVPLDTDNVNIAQIKVQNQDDLKDNAPTTAEVQVVDGSLYLGPRGRKLLKKDIRGKQFELHVVHDADRHQIDVYVDGVKHSREDYWIGQNLSYYFKCGVYASCQSKKPSPRMEATFNSIAIFANCMSSVAVNATVASSNSSE